MSNRAQLTEIAFYRNGLSGYGWYMPQKYYKLETTCILVIS